MCNKLIITVFMIVSLLVSSASATDILPMRQQAKAPPIASEKAHRILQQRNVPETRAGEETEITTEIQTLAAGLRYDPQLIYEHVRNNIDYVPVYGSKKNATATLLDGAGNDFDQTSLLIALMRASGYTSTYIYGMVHLSGAQIVSMLGCDNDGNVVAKALAYGGIPGTTYVYPNGTVAYVEIDHVWAKVNIGGTDYAFDPSVKSYEFQGEIDLAAAMGYDQGSFLTDIFTGATLDPDYVQNINHANMHADFEQYTENLVGAIKAANGASLSEVVGGWEIEPVRDQTFVSTLPYELSRDFEWTDVPSTYQAIMRIQHEGIDEYLSSAAVYGKRLTMTYNASNEPELRLDGTLLATGNTTSPGSYYTCTVYVDHPYAASGGAYCDQSNSTQFLSGGTYLFVNNWTATGRDTVDRHKRILGEYLEAGYAADSEEVIGETLCILALTWLGETSMAEKLADQIGDTITLAHHVVGYCGYTTSSYIDLPMGATSVISTHDDADQENATFTALSGISSAFEWGIFDQLQPISAVCTVKLIDMSNAKSDKIFDASSTNYYTTVKPQLVNYNTWELATVESYINAGYRVILPQDGDLTEKQWTGMGFIILSPGGAIGHIISGGLSGGNQTEPGEPDPDQASESGDEGNQPGEHDQSDEPIDLFTGDYLYESTDLELGSGSFPFRLAFNRIYNSALKGTDSVLGRGWTHNLVYRVTVDSDGFKGLGQGDPADAAPEIVELFIAMDLLYGTQAIDRIVPATIGHKWFMDRLIDNVVNIEMGGTNHRFLALPDGTYNAPAGNADLLTKEADESFLIETPDGSTLDFNTDGRLDTWVDRNGNTISFAYVDDKLQSVNNGMSRSLSFNYVSDRLATVTDHGGRSVTYTYDVDGNLVGYNDVELNDTIYDYDLPGRMTQIFYPADPSDPFVTNTYDDMHHVITQTDGEGNTYNYYYSGARTEEENPLTDSMVYHFNENGKTVLFIDADGNEFEYDYDGENRLVAEIYPGLFNISYAYEYDDRHNPVKKTINPIPYSGKDPLDETFTYDEDFNGLESYTDRMGRLTTFAYDGNGNLLTITEPEVGGVSPQITYTYNSRGQVLTKTDQEGMITQHSYDPVTADLLSTVADLGGHDITNSMLYDTIGNITDRTDPMGDTTSFQYNNRRQITLITAPAPYLYQTVYEYDENGNRTRKQRETGEVSEPWQTYDYTYTVTNRLETDVDPEGDTTLYEYDSLNRLWKTTDAELNTTEFLYDARGKLFQVIDASGQTCEEHLYTINGDKKSIEDANGNVNTYAYDSYDRLNKIKFADNSYEQFELDDVGNVLEQRMRSGETLTFVYDDLDRITDKTVSGKWPEAIQYDYDLMGRITDAIDNRGIIHNDYDTAGRLIAVTYPGSLTVVYAYDDANRRTSLVYPDSYSVTYEYDELGRTVDILEAGTTLLAHYDYDALSRRVGITYGNGAAVTYGFELDDDCGSIDHTFNGSAINLSYTYDLAGNRLSRIDGAGTTSYVYDSTYRLTDATQPVSAYGFNYDFAGNRTSVVVDGLTTPYTTNLLNQYDTVNGVAYSYDSCGNLIRNGDLRYSFDTENRLKRISKADRLVIYSYDPLGRRISKKITAMGAPRDTAGKGPSGPGTGPMSPEEPTTYQHSRFLYDGHQVIMEYDAVTSAMTRRFVYGPVVDEPVLMSDGTDAYYYHCNAMSSVEALSDALGQLAESYSYTPFGIPETIGTLGNPYLFAGRRWDAESGLYYYRNRYYDSKIGRFMQPDPVYFFSDVNLYAYCANNPINFVDPNGLGYFASRPLGGWPWIPGASHNPLDDWTNTEVSHEQIFFEDDQGGNIGFFDDSTLKEESDPQGYHTTKTGYDDALLRQAVDNVPLQPYHLLWQPSPNKEKFNCQDYAEAVRKEYERLKKLQESTQNNK